MKRFASIGLALLFVATLILPMGTMAAPKTVAPIGGGGEVHVYYNFEKELAPWKPVTDSPYHKFWMEQREGGACSQMTDWHYARLVSYRPPTPDFQIPYPLATWTTNSFPVTGQGIRMVTVRWAAKWDLTSSVGTPSNIYPTVYVGTTEPTKAGQFSTLTTPLKATWYNYSYKSLVNVGGSADVATVYVALGWNGVNNSIGLDCIDISIEYWPTNR